MNKTIWTIWRLFVIAILFSFSTGLIAQNSAPVFTSAPQPFAVPDFEYKYGISVFDPDGDAVTLGSTGLPSWLTLEEMTIPEFNSSGRYYAGTDGIRRMDVAPDGKLWFWNDMSQTFKKMNPDGSELEDVNTDAVQVIAMDFGSDGTLYITGASADWTVGGLLRLRPDSSNFEQMHGDAGCVYDMAVASDGSVWAANNCTGGIWHYSADTSTYESYDNLGINNPMGIGIHPDGSVWFSEGNWDGAVWRLDPSDTTITSMLNYMDANVHHGNDIEIDGNGTVVAKFNEGIYHIIDSLNHNRIANEWVEYICSNPAIGEIWGNTWDEFIRLTPVYDFLHGTPSVSDHGEHSISISAYDDLGNTSSQDFTLMVDSTIVYHSVHMDSNLADPANLDHVSDGLTLGWTTENCECDGCNENQMINYEVETCYQWGDWEGLTGGSPFGTLWSESNSDSSTITDYELFQYWRLKEASSRGKAVSMWDITENKKYDINPTEVWPDQGDYYGQVLSYFRIARGEGFPILPHIASIADVPEDQGGRVYVTFFKSAWDTDSPNGGRSTESYTIQRKDGDTWVGLTSIGAYSSDEYVVEVSTLNDSDDDGNNEAEIRVIANMDEGTFIGAVASGYSSDNIAPDAPDDLGGQIVDGTAELEWAASTANDLAYYNVYRGATEDFVHNEDSFIGESETSDFIDAAMAAGDNYYIVTAVDIHDNESDASDAVSLTSMSVDGGAGVPDVFALHQNFPNPFNPVTNIRFDVPENSMVSMAIYDLLGHKVRTLINYEMNAGFHSIQWNGTNDHGNPLASGMYIYRINAGEFHAVKKLVFMK